MEIELNPDYTYSMGDCIDANISRSLDFIALDGSTSWEENGELITASFDDTLSEEKSRRRLRVALGGINHFKTALFKHANNKLNYLRSNEQPNAANLIFTMDIKEAALMKQIVVRETGIEPSVIHNQMPDASSIFEDFKNGSDPHIITVKMINEGANVKRARVVTYATNVKEALTFEQIVTRVCRKESFEQTGHGYIYMPNDPDLVKMAANIEGMRLTTVIPDGDEMEALIHNENSSSMKTFIPISAQANGYNGIFRGQYADKKEMDLAKTWRNNFPYLANSLSDVDLAKILATQQPNDLQAEPEMPIIIPKETHDDKLSRVKKRIVKLVNKFAQIKNLEPREIHRIWLDMGKPRHDVASLSDLETKSVWLSEQIENSSVGMGDL